MDMSKLLELFDEIVALRPQIEAECKDEEGEEEDGEEMPEKAHKKKRKGLEALIDVAVEKE